MAVNGECWHLLKGRCERLLTRLATTAPELESHGDGFGLRSAPVPGAATLVPGYFLRLIDRKTTDAPPRMARTPVSASLSRPAQTLPTPGQHGKTGLCGKEVSECRQIRLAANVMRFAVF